jgi:DNA-binding protein H-NS
MGKKRHLDGMSIDEIWRLHQVVIRTLSVKLMSEKRALEKRLSQLRREGKSRQQSNAVDWQSNKGLGKRRKYPRVSPKYRNPNEPSETWSGRGKRPRWLAAALKAGHTIDEFAISNAELSRTNSRRQRQELA